MSQEHKEFSVSDVEYNLITTLSNLLQSEEVLTRYTDDARKAGDEDIATAFGELRQQNSRIAVRLRELLHRQIMNG